MSTILYLLGEAFINLRRNVLVATGAVLAVFVSLALAFGALVFNELVRVNTLQWQAGDHLIIFLKDEGGPVAHNDLLEQIQGYEEVERAWYLDKAGAYQEFQQMYSDQPALGRRPVGIHQGRTQGCIGLPGGSVQAGGTSPPEEAVGVQ